MPYVLTCALERPLPIQMRFRHITPALSLDARRYNRDRPASMPACLPARLPACMHAFLLAARPHVARCELCFRMLCTESPCAWRLNADLYDDGQTFSNNATGAEQASLRPNIFMAWRCFNRDVLAIHKFVCNEIAREHTRNTKEDFLGSS